MIAAADVPLGTPLSRVDAGAVTRRVEAIRQVASATVTLDWPDHVAIAVTERVPVMAVRMADGGYDLVDPSGVIVRLATAKPAAAAAVHHVAVGRRAARATPGSPPSRPCWRSWRPRWRGRSAACRSRQVPTGSGGGSFAESQQVTLSMKGGKTIVWGDPSNAAAKNRELEILLRSGVSYVNVSAPGTVVTR